MELSYQPGSKYFEQKKIERSSQCAFIFFPINKISGKGRATHIIVVAPFIKKYEF